MRNLQLLNFNKGDANSFDSTKANSSPELKLSPEQSAASECQNVLVQLVHLLARQVRRELSKPHTETDYEQHQSGEEQ